MKLYALGTAGYHPNNQRQTSCYYIPEASLMLDAGSGLHRLLDQSANWSAPNDRLDIFLSHAHLDHVLGLTFLLDVFHATPIRKVRVFGEAAKLDAIRQNIFSSLIFPVMPSVQWVEIDQIVEPIDIGCGGKLLSFPLAHPGGSRGFRIDWTDRSLAYITDTTAKQDSHYEKWLTKLDLLVHECNFTDQFPELAELTGHSCTSQVAELAKRVQPRKLLLTHVNPLADPNDPVNIESATKIFPPSLVAEDMMEIEF